MTQFIVILLLITNTLLLGILIILVLKYILLKKRKTIQNNNLFMDLPFLPPHSSIITLTENELWDELRRCLSNEDYERASTIRDILEKIKRDKGDLE